MHNTNAYCSLPETPVNPVEISHIVGTRNGHFIAALATAIPFDELKFTERMVRAPFSTRFDWFYDHSLQRPFLPCDRHFSSVSVYRASNVAKQEPSISDVHQFLSSFQVPFSFERHEWIDTSFTLDPTYPHYFKPGLKQVPVFAKMYSSKNIGEFVERLVDNFKCSSMNLRDSGEEADDLEEKLEILKSTQMKYNELF